jgi:hypothetical protein
LTHYEDVLAELREKGSRLANEYIVELYNILRYEENLPPEDCRAMIEHDCVDLWSKATIRKYLPPEAKDPKKQNAGKIGGENKSNKNKNKNATLLVTHAAYGARTDLAENNSISQNEQESLTFHNDLNQKLEARTPSPELVEAHKMNEEKERKIEELQQKLERITIEGRFKVYRGLVDYLLRAANKIRENNKEKDYLYFITQGFDLLAIADHLPKSDQEIEDLVTST